MASKPPNPDRTLHPTERPDRRACTESPQKPHQLRHFFTDRDAAIGSGEEPDWDQHLDVIRASRSRGAAQS